MVEQNDITQNEELFTCFLGSTADDPTSFYTFGVIDETVIPSGSQITYTPVDSSQGFWMFDSASASVNGEQITLSNNMAIADTGTTLMLVSDQVVEAVYNAIPGSTYSRKQQGYLFPASTDVNDLPEITVMVGSTPVTIAKQHLAFGPAQHGFKYGAIQSRGNQPFDILGDVFLRSVYAVSTISASVGLRLTN